MTQLTMKPVRRWMSIDLKTETAKCFRRFLKLREITYELSQAYEFIHFEVLVNDDECKLCNDFLDAIYGGNS